MHPPPVWPQDNSKAGAFHIPDLHQGQQLNWGYWYILGVPLRVVTASFLVGGHNYGGQHLETGSRGLGKNSLHDSVQNLASIRWHFDDVLACNQK